VAGNFWFSGLEARRRARPPSFLEYFGDLQFKICAKNLNSTIQQSHLAKKNATIQRGG